MSMSIVSKEEFDHYTIKYNVTSSTKSISMESIDILVSCIYSTLFLTGVSANIWVLIVMTVVSRFNITAYTNVSFFTVSLTCVNLIILFTIPATVTDLVLADWILPDVFCPIYWMSEILNKIMSSLIVSFIAVSCFFGVCKPHVKSMYKSATVACLHMGIGFVFVAWKSCEIWERSKVQYILEFEDENRTLEIHSRKCMFDVNADDRYAFTFSAFAFGYLVPVSIMITCYGSILIRIYKRSRFLTRRGMSQFQNVAKSASILVVFYMCTWTPYWCVTILLTVLPEHESERVGTVAFFFHALPMINCAYSPLIYTLLNRNMREQYKTLIRKSNSKKRRQIRAMII